MLRSSVEPKDQDPAMAQEMNRIAIGMRRPGRHGSSDGDSVNLGAKQIYSPEAPYIRMIKND